MERRETVSRERNGGAFRGAAGEVVMRCPRGVVVQAKAGWLAGTVESSKRHSTSPVAHNTILLVLANNAGKRARLRGEVRCAQRQTVARVLRLRMTTNSGHGCPQSTALARQLFLLGSHRHRWAHAQVGLAVSALTASLKTHGCKHQLKEQYADHHQQTTSFLSRLKTRKHI